VSEGFAPVAELKLVGLGCVSGVGVGTVGHQRNRQPPALSSDTPHLYLAAPLRELLYYAHLLATKQLVYIDMERTKLGSDNSSCWLLPIDVPPWDELAFGAVLEGCGGSVGSLFSLSLSSWFSAAVFSYLCDERRGGEGGEHVCVRPAMYHTC
jgi:hypothetical protein